MCLTTDNVRASPAPNTWRIRGLMAAIIALAVSLVVFCCAVLAFGTFVLGLALPVLQTLSFVTVVFGDQAMIYAIGGSLHLWNIWPSLLLAGSSVVDVAIACVLAVAGIAMAPLSTSIVASTLPAASVFAVVLDLGKWPVFARLGLM